MRHFIRSEMKLLPSHSCRNKIVISKKSHARSIQIYNHRWPEEMRENTNSNTVQLVTQARHVTPSHTISKEKRETLLYLPAGTI